MTNYTTMRHGVLHLNPKDGDRFRCLWTNAPDWWTVRRVYTWSREKRLTSDDGEYTLNGSCAVWERVDPVQDAPAYEPSLISFRDVVAMEMMSSCDGNPNLPGDPASQVEWPSPETLATRRAKWAVLQADALVAALRTNREPQAADDGADQWTTPDPLSEATIEAVARAFCERLGLDPDEAVILVIDASKPDGPMWRRYERKARDAIAMQLAISEGLK